MSNFILKTGGKAQNYYMQQFKYNNNCKMDSLEAESWVPDQYLCPITRQVMRDPVIIDTGRSYQKRVILQWFGKGRVTDPCTNQELGSTKVIPNLNLRSLIDKLPQQKKKIQQRQDYQLAIKMLQQAWGPVSTPKGISKVQDKPVSSRQRQLEQKIKALEKQNEELKRKVVYQQKKPQKQQYQKVVKKSVIPEKIIPQTNDFKDIDLLPNKAYFDISLDDKYCGRIVFQLFDKIVPKTTKNFKVFCTRSASQGYKNSIFHRIITDFMAQGGDFINHNGTGSKSIYGERFNDQNFELKHDKPYLLSMANAGKNTNGSQFFITFVPCPWLDGKHVVFGKVIEGKQIVDIFNKKVGSQNGKPKMKVKITDCGLLQ